ncbi:hypothetical protein XFPR_03590 [Xylella fastidiosa]|uniref:hypothetical protein n=1 Tax=Xylella fastidiosa TaxID=2371 RepID=UPI0003D36F75|nr:hypothetical protein [Xylella fastidiosa]ALR03848.1 hypothetical protein XFPR_03590 [Xylella fastidiosa]KXB22546.1 hypothetical protein ADT30_01070 [Xylella fastidiosa]OJZ71810.1 hypothetical protein B375_0203520 [Xylella fastidiosa 6c]
MNKNNKIKAISCSALRNSAKEIQRNSFTHKKTAFFLGGFHCFYPEFKKAPPCVKGTEEGKLDTQEALAKQT